MIVAVECHKYQYPSSYFSIRAGRSGLVDPDTAGVIFVWRRCIIIMPWRLPIRPLVRPAGTASMRYYPGW